MAQAYGSQANPVRQDMFQYIIEVHLPKKKPPEDDADLFDGRVTGSIPWNVLGGGISSDGLAEGEYIGPEFNGGFAASISGTMFARVVGSGSIGFSVHFEIVEAGDEVTLGPVVATGASETVSGSVSEEGEPFEEGKPLSVARRTPLGANSLFHAKAVVTGSSVSNKDIIAGVWLGAGVSGWNATITFAN